MTRHFPRNMLFIASGILPALSCTVAYAAANHTNASQSTIEVIASPFNSDGHTENTHSYTTNHMTSATGLPLSIRQTPQSVSVITSQQIKDGDMRSLVDIMANTAGISAYNYDMERYSFSSRGFSITNYQYDGIPTSFNTGYSAGESAVDPVIYDRVEVVRGATGLLTGAGNPSASVNLLRKHANSRDFTADISASAGSWQTYRTTLDVAAPLISSGNLRGRLITGWQDGKSYIDRYQKQQKILYAVIDADLSDNTLLSAGFNYQDNKPKGSSWGGFPLWYADGGRTDWQRSLNVGADWTGWASTTQSAFITLKHQFDNQWHIQASAAWSYHAMDGKLLFLTGWPDRHTGQNMNASPAWYIGNHQQYSADVKATAPFTLFNLDHQLILGISMAHQKSAIDYHGNGNASRIPVGNFLHWNGSYPEPQWLEAVPANYDSTSQQGEYAALKLSLADPLTLIVGGRYSQWKTDAESSFYDHYTFNKKAFTPYAGLLYDFTSHYTAYLSYTSIFNPQDYRNRDGKWLDPLEGKSWETGIKGQYFDGALNASIALFHTKQNNLPQPDTGHVIPGTANQAYYAAQGTRSHGIEMEIAGEITPGWNLAASYSWWNGQDNQGQPITTRQPRTLLRGFTSWQFPGNWKNLTIGGGINWQSSVYAIADSPNGKERVAQSGYAVTNLMANYRFNGHFSAQLNINNLFNRKYYNQIGFYSQGSWAAERNVTLTLRYSL